MPCASSKPWALLLSVLVSLTFPLASATAQQATVTTETLDRPDGMPYQWKYVVFNADGSAIAAIADNGDHFQWVTNVADTLIHALRPGLPMTLSNDGKRYAYSIVDENKYDQVVVDGKIQPKYPSVNKFAFSPDSKRYAYEALVGTRESWYHNIVVDGELKNERTLGIFHPTFSPDSKRLAYIRVMGSYQALVIEGEEQERWPEGIVDVPLAWSRDSKRVAYRYFKNENGRTLHMTDGRIELGPVQVITHMAYFPDGTLVCNAGVPDTGAMTFHEDGKPVGEPYTWTYPELYPSPDHTRYAYVAARREKRYMAINRDIGEQTFDGVSNDHIVWSPDGKRLAFAAKTDNRWHVALRGEEMTPVGKVFAIGFTPDSKQWVAVVRQNKQPVILRDGEQIAADVPEPIKGSKIWFSDTETFHYWARLGDEIARVDVQLSE